MRFYKEKVAAGVVDRIAISVATKSRVYILRGAKKFGFWEVEKHERFGS
jgi:hypothetical protein